MSTLPPNDPDARRETAQNAQLRYPRLASTGRERHDKVIGLIDTPRGRVELGGPKLDLGLPSAVQDGEIEGPQRWPGGRVATRWSERQPMVEAAIPEIVQKVDGQPMEPPLRHEIELGRRLQALSQVLKRSVEQGALAAFKREKEHRHRAKEAIGQREINSVEKEAGVVGLGSADELVDQKLVFEGSSESVVRTRAFGPEGKDCALKLVEIPEHQLRDCALCS